jgi:FKBP-type peptidyl-prolyl cis-trans isomerase
VITTASGLQYEIVTQGTGPLPALTDMVSCNYRGTFIDGAEFDNSFKTGKPVVFKVTGVIQGWTEVLQMMPVGSKWKLYIPYQLGYGPGKYNDIPGGSVLLFELELVGIQGK